MDVALPVSGAAESRSEKQFLQSAWVTHFQEID